ncbi:cdc42 effector protein 3-like [Brienomyrus brachyistius]|uniref:cdc42 effector protein 3-like n=1 Tax=Brienomyrus brachyistius TaxID=42636 RepID=UPI0020B40A6F|nr:cdc42 effector protein 3-like [Brienomyrus brachyistius]
MNRWPSWSQKHRGSLSVNMISLPLGDFRHLSHIGRENHQDNFGDLSFLRPGHNLLLQSSKSEQNLLLACAPPPKPPRLNQESPETQGPPDWKVRGQSSQRRKICSSLPLLDSEEGEEPASEEAEVGGSSGQDSPRLDSTGQGSVSSGGDEDSFRAKMEEVLPEGDDSIFSLDLGPSILDDVLRVMDRFH